MAVRALVTVGLTLSVVQRRGGVIFIGVLLADQFPGPIGFEAYNWNVYIPQDTKQ